MLNRDAASFRGQPRATRRGLLAGAAAVLAGAGRQARAAIRNGVVVGNDGWLYPPAEDIRNVVPARYEAVCQLAGRVAGMLRDKGIAPVILLIPTKARIYPEFLPADFQPSAAANARYAHALELLRASGAVVPDLASRIAARRREQSELLFLKTDTHWTGTAAEAAAIETASRVLEATKLPSSRLAGTKLSGTVTNKLEGDLGRALGEPESRNYPPESFVAVKTADAETFNLLAEDRADTVIIGNSYMLPHFAFPQVLSNRLNRPVFLHWKAGLNGPFKIMLEYFDSKAYRSLPPKLALWVLMEGALEQGPDSTWWDPAARMTPAEFTAALGRSLAAR